MTTIDMLPSKRICFLGAGKLLDGLLEAAHRLGYQTMVWAPEKADVHITGADQLFIKPYDCIETFTTVLTTADVSTVVSMEVPLSVPVALEHEKAVVRPNCNALSTMQFRIVGKRLAWDIPIPTVPTVCMPHGEEWAREWRHHLPGILKVNSVSLGSGEKQWRVETEQDLRTALEEAQTNCVLEKRVDVRTTISILTGRFATGEVLPLNVALSHTKEGGGDNGLDRTVQIVQDTAKRIIKKLDLQGMLTLRFLVDMDGNVYFDKIALGLPDSDDLYEQYIRTICNAPVVAA